MTSHHHCVQIVPIFNHLDKESQALVASKANHYRYAKGEFIYHAGDTSHALYIVHQGMIRIFHMNNQGEEQITRLLLPGDYLGEWTIFHPKQVHNDFAQAMKTSEICVIQGQDFQALLSEYPDISLKLLSSLSQRLQDSEQHAVKLSTQSVTHRVTSFLAEQDVIEEKDNGTIIQLALAKKDIASYLGMKPETFSRTLRKLEDSGYLRSLTPNKILIYDMDQMLLADC